MQSLRPIKSDRIYFASAPERVNPGDPNWNQRNTPRLVGAIDEQSQKKALAFYESICDEAVSVSSPEIAEAAKLLENTFRLVNIALVNELAQICFKADIPVQEVIDAAASKPYGFMAFRPGVGVGGHCIPVDPMYLSWWARKQGVTAQLVEASAEINRTMPHYVATRAFDLIGAGISKPRILILGVAYKPGVADVRETPVLELREYLVSNGAEVAWCDPLVNDWGGTKSVSLNWPCDLAILATRQPGLDVADLIARGTPILDCTNSFTNVHGIYPL